MLRVAYAAIVVHFRQIFALESISVFVYTCRCICGTNALVLYRYLRQEQHLMGRHSWERVGTAAVYHTGIQVHKYARTGTDRLNILFQVKVS